MLKIKEYRFVPAEDGRNLKKEYINLKELEKFGFKQDVYIDKCYVKTFEIGTAYKEEIIVWEKERNIQITHAIRLLDTVYDLIKSDLVEKVEG